MRVSTSVPAARYAPVQAPTFEQLIADNPVEQERLKCLRESLSAFVGLIAGRRVLDFGASAGLSAVVLSELGASSVVGVEPDGTRVERGKGMLRAAGWAVELLHVADTRHLPLPANSFGFILANAVFEHIPQPRAAYVRELWRVLAPGGFLLINETPNKYLPVDFHTLHLPLTNWLPSSWAHWIGVRTGRFRADRTDWAYSGWRGMGHYELVRAIPEPHIVLHEHRRPRHRVLRRLGLPSGLLDPYPVHLIHKP